MLYLEGKTIKLLREKRNLTQKQLSEKLNISDKAISKWETGRGLPDISILPDLAQCLNVSLTELMTGSIANNDNRSANMLKTAFYVCPVCGNVIHSIGSGAFSCCGINLPELEAEEDAGHYMTVEKTDGCYYVHMEHEMTRKCYISFIAYTTTDTLQFVKLYPEQDADCRFPIQGPGYLYAYCNRHGLFRQKL